MLKPIFAVKSLPNLLWIIQLSCYFLYSGTINAQVLPQKDSTVVVLKADSIKIIRTDSFRISKDAIEETIEYAAEDSCIFNLKEKKAYLYGNASVKFEGMDLKAALIIVDFNKKEIYAKGRYDSLGKYVDKPIFNDGERETLADTMLYNFNTKKGRTYGITLKEDDGYIICNKVFRDADNSIYSDEGKYTTCNRTDHPHFYLKAKNLKIIPGNKIIFGPSNLVIEGIPTPLVLPFGLFPTKKGKRSGLIPFEYGLSPNFGPSIKGIGYHFAISEQFDQSITGDIYFRGGWRIAANSRYNQIYKRNGNFRIEFGKYILSEREDPLFKLKTQRTMAIVWNHNQDAKAKPGSTFIAKVDVQKENAAQFGANNAAAIVKNEFGSSIAYSKSLFKNKANLTLGFLHRQNTQSRDFSVSLPNLNFSVQRITPFAKPNKIGKYKWYKDFGISYQLDFENRIDTKDSIFFSGKHIQELFPSININTPVILSQLDKFKTGVVHNIPITLGSYKFFKSKFSFTPTVSYKEYWYFKTIDKSWNAAKFKMDTSYNYGFSRSNEYSASGNIGTQIFGTYQMSGKKVSAIRHTIQPNVSISYRPDFGKPQYGIYKTIQSDTSKDRFGNFRTQTFSKYEGGLKGGPGRSANGIIAFNMGNNLQAKVLKTMDSIKKYENVTWIENLSLSGNYDLLKDSFQLSNIGINGFTTLFKKININGNASLDPYSKNNQRRLNQFEVLNSGRLGTITNATMSMNTNFNSDMFKPKKDTANNTKTEEEKKEMEEMLRNPDAFVNFDRIWELGVNYSFTYSRNNYKSSHEHTLNLNGSFNLSPKWKVGCNTGYDFKQKTLTYTQFEISRYLHCWALNFSWIPDGFRKSFMFSLRVNSSVLESLKVDKKRFWFDQ